MSMPQARFEQLVHRLETFAQQKPDRYKFQVRLFAWLGYGYIVIVLALIIILSIAFVPKLFGILAYVRSGRLMLFILLFGVGIPVVLVFSILDALWFRIPAPDGLELKSNQVPRLFKLIRELQKELQTPPFHHVLLTDDFNAAVAQIPRFGFFGGYRNYLIVGLPLLQSLSPSQFRAVLAHELGHLSGKHGQFSHWIYRIRQSWYQLLAGLERTGHQTDEGSVALMLTTASLIGRGIFVLFFRWYAPFFAAYSFVLARADEYEADRYAAKLAGAKNLASALVNLEIKGGYLLPNYWSSIAAKVDEQVDPPEPYTELATQMQQALPPEQVKPWLKSVLERKTTTADTHPCLTDRLRQVGCKPSQTLALLKPSPMTAATQFLGPSCASLVQHFNKVWQGAVAPKWRARYQETQQLQEKLESLNTAAVDAPLPLDKRWQRASLTADLKGIEAARSDVEAILAEQSDHLGANGLLGQILLAKGDRAGIPHLEKLMMRDVPTYNQGAKLIYAFLQQHDGQEAADQYLDKARQQRDQVEQARLERSNITQHHTLLLPDLTPDQRQSLHAQLKTYEGIKVVYFVQKQMQYLPDSPLYILAIEPTETILKAQGERSPQSQLMTRLSNELELPGETLIVLLGSNRTALKVKLRAMDGARLYPSAP